MSNEVKIGLDAGDVKSALRRHHPAYHGPSGMPWICLEEWCNIDLLAIDCWQSAKVIGYEVKVSRGDMRSELLDPFKRADAVSRCTQFYFAVPEGMLTRDEVMFDEPDWTPEDFERAPCPGVPVIEGQKVRGRGSRLGGGPCSNPRLDHRGRSRRRRFVARDTPAGFSVILPVPAVLRPTSSSTSYVGGDPVTTYSSWAITDAVESQGYSRVRCPVCGGTGRSELSRVEREAPTLWVPKDVGLVEIGRAGVRIVKLAPINKTPRMITGERVDGEAENRASRQGIAQLARWASVRPDPRHGHRR